MRRVHLFEVEDQPWCPGVVRDGLTAYLSFVVRASGMLAPVLPVLVDWLTRAEAARVVDLCSGAGFPARALAEAARRAGAPIPVVCTDLHPNADGLAQAESAGDGGVEVWPGSVDARAVPAALTGARTLFNGFHHFRPDDARRILADAHDAGQPIAVVELVDRRPANLLGMAFVPLAVLATVPFFRPFRWAWIPLTYGLPVLPLIGWWDGVVSCLRIYQPEELRELVAGLDGFDWRIDRIPLPGAPIHATVLTGAPRGP